MINKIRQYIDELNYHTKLYDLGKPVISDTEWDKKYFELEKLEKESGIIYPDSPTQSISYTIQSELNKKVHDHKMLSLAKTKELSEVASFVKGHDYLAMLKMDGLTCSLTYENGVLVSAETRGNGEEGEDITHNARVLPSIPQTIPYKNRLVVDGEVICTFKDFEKFENEYANPRNFAAGSIRLLSSKECAERNLTFVAWDIIEGFEEITNSLDAKLDYVLALGFTVVPHYIIKTSETATSNWHMEVIRNNLEQDAQLGCYPIDGLVYKFDDIAYGKTLGATAHHFRNAIAFKFFEETYETKLLDIEYSLGRTGVLTPVAIFEPVEIDGTTVQRASLHNLSIIEELFGENEPYKNQKIEVFKAHEINPQIRWADTDLLNGENPVLAYPKVCPVCGGKTVIKQENDSKVLCCDNTACEGKLINRLDHFCGKKGLDIKGLSKATIEKLINWEWVSCIEDLFKLKDYRAEWVKKPGFGQKSVDKVLNAIEEAKTCELHQFISAIGIPLIGSTAAKELQNIFKSWDVFYDAVVNKYKFWEINDFGPEKHLAIHNFNYQEAVELAKYLNFNEVLVEGTVQSINLKGLNFVITGKLLEFKNRDELKAYIESNGGKVVGSVSKNTHYLINNDIDSTSSKNIRARELDIPIIDEKTFLEKFKK